MNDFLIGRRALWLAVPLLALAACGSGPVNEKTLTADLWTACSIANDDIMNGEVAKNIEAGKTDPGDGLVLCKVVVDKVDGGWTLLMVPDKYDAGVQIAQSVIISQFGRKTGCYGDLDIDKMDHTRALDGRVESANGKASWTYHPDAGLNIVCEA